MRKIYCDLCGEEINSIDKEMRGTFENRDGVLVEVRITSPHPADLCKKCVIEIIEKGYVVSWMERSKKERAANV